VRCGPRRIFPGSHVLSPAAGGGSALVVAASWPGTARRRPLRLASESRSPRHLALMAWARALRRAVQGKQPGMTRIMIPAQHPACH
jgi:hypothetical protein